MTPDIYTDIVTAYPYCYNNENWVTPISEALIDLTSENALTRVSPESKTVWEIVLHLTTWNINIIDRIDRQDKVGARAESWPAIPDRPAPDDWETAKFELFKSFESIDLLLKSSSSETLNRNPYGVPDMLCRFFHASYHIGQITVLADVIRTSGR